MGTVDDIPSERVALGGDAAAAAHGAGRRPQAGAMCVPSVPLGDVTVGDAMVVDVSPERNEKDGLSV